MRMRQPVFLVLLSVLLCSFLFLSMSPSIVAHADDVNTRYQISASSWSDFYDTIPASVLGQDGQYHDVDFLFQGQYAGITSSGLCYYPDGQAFNTSTFPMVWYSCPYPIYNDSQNNALWEVDKVILHLNLHLSSCEFVRFGFCGATSSINGFYNLNYYAVDHYNYADYYINTSENHSTIPLGFYDTNYQYPCRLYNNSGSGGIRNIAYTSSADIYITDVVLSCVDRGIADAGFIWVGFYLPFVSGNTVLEERGLPSEPVDPDFDWGDGLSVGEVTGTIENDGNGTQNVNVTVTTDNTGFLAGILNGLRNLFIPSSEDIQDFTSDLQDEFREHLGAVSQAVDLIDEQADYFRAAVSTNYVYFPELEIPIDGVDYTIIQGQQVELRPANTGSTLGVLWDAVAIAVDIVCVLAVLNMLQTKYEIFLNPDGEVIDYDS